MMLGRTFLILAAITFDIILASTFSKDIGRQFFKSELSLPFFSIEVIIIIIIILMIIIVIIIIIIKIIIPYLKK